jgi:hypothetical protein
LKRILIFPIFIFTFLLSGCFEDPVQEELLVYVNEDLSDIVALEEEAILAYHSVTGANYTSDQALYDALLFDVIPTYQEFADKLEAIRLETEEVREIHEGYIEGVNLQYNAFIKIVTALEEQDRGMIEEANLMLDESRKLLRDFNYDIQKLADEHQVELTETFQTETTGI